MHIIPKVDRCKILRNCNSCLKLNSRIPFSWKCNNSFAFATTLNFITYIERLCTYILAKQSIIVDFFLYGMNKSIVIFTKVLIPHVLLCLALHWLVMLLCSWCHKSPLRQNTICLKMEHKS